MKYILNIVFLFTLLNTSLFSNEEIESKELYLEYNSFPQRVFTGQKFEVELKALILKDPTSYDKIVTTFTQEPNIEVLTQDVVWIKNESSEYKTTIAYKVHQDAFTLPKITLALSKDEEIIDFISIDSPFIKYEKIAVNQKLFSNVIANDLEVMTVKTKQYTNNVLHTTINIKGINSNLEDFKLNEYPEDQQGINSLTDIHPEQNLYYYVMIPSHTKELKFNYYNSNSKDFVMITIPIILDEELVSTQTELNPYNSSILIYKQVFSGVLLLISVILFAITRNNIYLIFITIFIVILAYLFIPNQKVLLNKGLSVYILPTNNSTVFKKLERKNVVEIVNEKNDFIKVLFDNESIGWIKKDDI
ncbi:MAG: hypothetical protein WBG69_11205 [Arcobacteraceae bacterium]